LSFLAIYILTGTNSISISIIYNYTCPLKKIMTVCKKKEPCWNWSGSGNIVPIYEDGKKNDFWLQRSGISMWFERWFLSSNAKDIGVLYLIYALFSGLVGTAFSVLIRLELSGPGVQFIADNQLYNSIITAHAILMIFFMVMPALIGGFGNFLLPLGLGGPDMGFPRLNNISYLLLLPSIVLFLFAGVIENGVGTGWTLTMEYSNGFFFFNLKRF